MALTAITRASFWALVALIVFGIVPIFVHIPGAELVYSVLGLVIFAGFTMFDFQRLRTSTDAAAAPLLAASIFLDVLNVFCSSCRSSLAKTDDWRTGLARALASTPGSEPGHAQRKALPHTDRGGTGGILAGAAGAVCLDTVQPLRILLLTRH
jgi:hypothetical protein